MFNLDQALGVFPQAALLRSKRAEVLAANIANADTPGYQARDFDFNAALANATAAGEPAAELARTQAGHLSLGSDDLGGAFLQFRTPTQASLDQNTVDVQAERARFVDNAMHYQATMRFLDGRFSGLIRAIRGD